MVGSYYGTPQRVRGRKQPSCCGAVTLAGCPMSNQDDPVVSAQTMVRGSAPNFGSFGAHGNSTHNDEISYPPTLAQVKASAGPDRWDHRLGGKAPGRVHIRDLSAFYYACCRECFVLPPAAGWLPWLRKAGLRPVRRAMTCSLETPVTVADPIRTPQARENGEPRTSPTLRAFGDSHQYASEPASSRFRRTPPPTGRRGPGPTRRTPIPF